MSDIDILITEDDLTLDIAKEPELVSGRASIAQDIKHMIRETGYVVLMVGERSQDLREHYMKLMEIAVEEDSRLVPGSAKVRQLNNSEISITASTVEYGSEALRA